MSLPHTSMYQSVALSLLSRMALVAILHYILIKSYTDFSKTTTKTTGIAWAVCHYPFASAMGKVWHPEHFTCSSCPLRATLVQ